MQLQHNTRLLPRFARTLLEWTTFPEMKDSTRVHQTSQTSRHCGGSSGSRKHSSWSPVTAVSASSLPISANANQLCAANLCDPSDCSRVEVGDLKPSRPNSNLARLHSQSLASVCWPLVSFLCCSVSKTKSSSC